MTIEDAYELVLEKIEELRNEGIEVTINPAGSADDKAVTQNADKGEGLPVNKWLHVSFNVSDEGHALKVREAGNYLGMAGIQFDSGGWQGLRDWELDWSFRYTGKEDEAWRDARDRMEDLIDRLG